MDRREFCSGFVALGIGTALRAQPATPAPGPGFKFSVMPWPLERQASLDRCLEIIAAAGYTGVQLTREPEKWAAGDRRHFLQRLHALGLTVDALSSGHIAVADPAQADGVLQLVRQHLALAEELDSPQLILTAGPRVAGLSDAAMAAATVDVLKRVADLLAHSGRQLVLEPVDRLERPDSWLNSVSQAFPIIRAVGSPQVQVLYDYYHEQRTAGNLIEKLEKNIDCIALVHIADVPGRHQPGTGEIDYTNIYRKLAELHYGKYIAMEFYPSGDPVAVLRAARLQAIQAERSVPRNLPA